MLKIARAGKIITPEAHQEKRLVELIIPSRCILHGMNPKSILPKECLPVPIYINVYLSSSRIDSELTLCEIQREGKVNSIFLGAGSALGSYFAKRSGGVAPIRNNLTLLLTTGCTFGIVPGNFGPSTFKTDHRGKTIIAARFLLDVMLFIICLPSTRNAGRVRRFKGNYWRLYSG